MRILLPFLIFLAACNTAGPGFRGIEPVTRSYDGSRFLIRRSGPLAEAIRTNPEFVPKFETVARKAALAVQDMTGCSAAWVVGDPAMMVIGLSCDGAAPPGKPKAKVSFSCDVEDAYRLDRIVELGLRCYKL